MFRSSNGVALAAVVVANLLGGALVAQAQTTTVAGKIPGQFTVSPSGAATYRIPIEVPPGVGGVQPQLALSYNSQAGNGLLGLGWGLGGLSAVVRCPRTQSSDGGNAAIQLNNADRFCLDGSKLLLTPTGQTYGAAGSIYRNEIDNFARIEAIGGDNGSSATYTGPSSFRVKTKEGLTLEYGASDNAKLQGNGKNAIIAWGLNSIKDRAGNVLSINYASARGDAQLYPQQIVYGGGTPQRNSVQFTYENTRIDQQIRYVGAVALGHTKLLTKVTLYSSNVLVGEYRLQYQADTTHRVNLLQQVQRCDGQNNCLKPLQMVLDAQPNVLAGNDIGTTVTDVGTQGQWIDANSDGKADFCRGINYKAIVDGWLARLHQTQAICNLADGAGFPIVTPGKTVNLPSDRAWLWQPPMLDLDGDGMVDHCGSVTRTWSEEGHIYFEPAAAFLCTVGDSMHTYHIHYSVMNGWPKNGSGIVPGDINGDGRDDYCAHAEFRINNDGDFVGRYFCALSTGGSVNIYMPVYDVGSLPRWLRDVNGDGRADYCFVNGNFSVECRLSYGSGFGGALSSPNVFGLANLEMTDFNGDGLPDLCGEVDAAHLRCLLNTGLGFSVVVDSPAMDLGTANVRAWADVNGDGAADFCTEVAGSKVACTLSAFSGFGTTVISPSINLGSAPKKWVDANGDGYADYCRLVGQALTCALSSFASRRVEQINGGQGRVSITYQSIASDLPSKIYTKVADSSPTLPKRYRQVAHTVVSQVDIEDGAGGVNTQTHQYSGLMEEVGTGRGYLGFRTHTVYDKTTAAQTVHTYEQNWPYVGQEVMRVRKVVSQNASQEVARTATTWNCLDPDTGAQCQVAIGQRYFVYPSKVEEKTWDLDASAYPSTTTEVSYALNPDGKFYGEVSKVTVSTSDGASRTTANVYYPADVSNWILGRVQTATTTFVKP